MRTIPRFFVSAVFMVTVIAHPFCIVFTISMSAVVYFFTKLALNYIFFLLFFTSGPEGSSALEVLSTCSKFYSFLDRSWMFKCIYWLISCCWTVNISTWLSLLPPYFWSPDETRSDSEISACGGSLMICSGLISLGVDNSMLEEEEPVAGTLLLRLKLSTW